MRYELLKYLPADKRLNVGHFNDGCPHPLTSPFVMSCKEGAKPDTTRDIQTWYRSHGIKIPSEKVYFYDDRINNIESFEEFQEQNGYTFNAYQISCKSRDFAQWGGAIGGCGATLEEISNKPGIHLCPRPEVPCSGRDTRENDVCRKHIEYGYCEGIDHEKAHEWYMDFKKYTGVEYRDGTIDDWQRAAYCGMNYQCGSPPCSCSCPPCDVCRVQSCEPAPDATTEAAFREKLCTQKSDDHEEQVEEDMEELEDPDEINKEVESPDAHDYNPEDFEDIANPEDGGRGFLSNWALVSIIGGLALLTLGAVSIFSQARPPQPEEPGYDTELAHRQN
jgi:hypothetical protein